MTQPPKRNILCLFDVDGTLTPSRRKVTQDMLDVLADLRTRIYTGFVGGSDLVKQQEQLGTEKINVVDLFDYAFPENGLQAFKDSNEISSTSFIEWIGEEKYKTLVNFCLRYIADLDIPIKRGTFIEFRKGLVNVSPVGRNVSNAERDQFDKYDKEHTVRKKLVTALRKEFEDYGLQFSIGGQISIDIFPRGWDKTYCLRHVVNEAFDEIHFFGDRAMEGGNDYEIFNDPRVIGHTVTSPEDTKKQLAELFLN